MQCNLLTEILATPLPSKSFQKRKLYRPSVTDLSTIYDAINNQIFDSVLTKPPLVLRRMRKIWGLCLGWDLPTPSTRIEINQNMFCVQWVVIILAHEMAHQYQWEILGESQLSSNEHTVMDHGASFFARSKQFAEYNIPLKIDYSGELWLTHQQVMNV